MTIIRLALLWLGTIPRLALDSLPVLAEPPTLVALAQLPLTAYGDSPSVDLIALVTTDEHNPITGAQFYR